MVVTRTPSSPSRKRPTRSKGGGLVSLTQSCKSNVHLDPDTPAPGPACPRAEWLSRVLITQLTLPAGLLEHGLPGPQPTPTAFTQTTSSGSRARQGRNDHGILEAEGTTSRWIGGPPTSPRAAAAPLGGENDVTRCSAVTTFVGGYQPTFLHLHPDAHSSPEGQEGRGAHCWFTFCLTGHPLPSPALRALSVALAVSCDFDTWRPKSLQGRGLGSFPSAESLQLSKTENSVIAIHATCS